MLIRLSLSLLQDGLFDTDKINPCKKCTNVKLGFRMNKNIKISQRLIKDRTILSDPRRPRRKSVVFIESNFVPRKKNPNRIAKTLQNLSGDLAIH